MIFNSAGYISPLMVIPPTNDEFTQIFILDILQKLSHKQLQSTLHISQTLDWFDNSTIMKISSHKRDNFYLLS